MSNEKSVNAEVIENLKTLGGMDLLIELHDVFIKTSQSLISEIHSAITNNDALALQEKAHSLKSSSGNMGALQLSQICLQLEKIGQSKQLDQAKNLGEALDSEFEKVALELSEITKK